MAREDFIREHHAGVVALLPVAEAPSRLRVLLTYCLRTRAAVASYLILRVKALKKD